MVQVENEYGSYSCDETYRRWIRDETLKYVDDRAILFTTDGIEHLSCGKIENVFATIDFGSNVNVDNQWKTLRKYQSNGPFVNMEYYLGWMSHWQQSLPTQSISNIINTFQQMLNTNASVNFYMFYGGTNFAFTSGANYNLTEKYLPDLTSYDYNAALDEAGDPTPKYWAIRNTIQDFKSLPNMSLPVKAPKMKLPNLILSPLVRLLSSVARQQLGSKPIQSMIPLTFEAIDQFSGFVLYETILPKLRFDPAVLSIPKLGDRAHVLVDNVISSHFMGD